MTTFSEKYQPVFEVVCRILGNGWRVNKLDNYQHRIKLTSTEIRKYSIIIRLERERFFIVGSVDSLVWHGNPSVCTVFLRAILLVLLMIYLGKSLLMHWMKLNCSGSMRAHYRKNKIKCE